MADDTFESNSERRPRSSRWSQGGRDDRGGSRRSDGERGGQRERYRDDRSGSRDSSRDSSDRRGRGDDRGGYRRDDRGFGGDRRQGSDRRDDRDGARGGYRRDDRGFGGRGRDDDRSEYGRRDDRGGFRRDDRAGGVERRGDGERGGYRRDDRGFSGGQGRDDRRRDGERGGYRRDERDDRRGPRRDDRGFGGERGGERRFGDNRGRDERGGNRGGFTGRGDRGAGWSDEQSSIRGPRSWDAKAVGDERPRRKPEPVLPEEITGYELDKAVRQQLRTLSKDNAEGVAKHLVAAAELLEDDPEKALDHAQHAVSRAGRVPAAREALGLVLYRTGEFAEALREFRTARRLSGSDHLLPYMVDCERGLGRYERALELANSPEAQRLSEADNIELAIVVSGVRRDMGQQRAAVVGLRIPALQKATTQPWAARLFYAYADALLDLGEREEARAWFVKADAADRDGETDAADRIDQIDGFELTDLTPEDEQESDPRLAEIDLSAFGGTHSRGVSETVREGEAREDETERQDPRD